MSNITVFARLLPAGNTRNYKLQASLAGYSLHWMFEAKKILNLILFMNLSVSSFS